LKLEVAKNDKDTGVEKWLEADLRRLAPSEP
jgi:hypothetical protein